jgi:hypothetical protein
MSIAAVVILVTVLVVMDPRVRDEARNLLRSDTWSADVSRMNAEAHGMASVLMSSAREQGLDHSSLVVFVLVASGLVVAMLRL